MKKIAWIMLLVLALGLVGCGSKEAEEVEVEETVEIEEEDLEEDLEEEEELEAEEVDDVEEAEEDEDGIPVTDYSATVYANTSANIRSGNGTDYDVIATVGVNTELNVVGKCDNGWYKLAYNGDVGYISSKVVSAAKVEVGTTSTGSSTSSGSTSSTASTTETATEEITTTTAGGYSFTDAISGFDANNVVSLANEKCTAASLTRDGSIAATAVSKSVTFEAGSGCFTADGKTFTSVDAMATYLADTIIASGASKFIIAASGYGTTEAYVSGGVTYGGNKYVTINLLWE